MTKSQHLLGDGVQLVVAEVGGGPPSLHHHRYLVGERENEIKKITYLSLNIEVMAV